MTWAANPCNPIVGRRWRRRLPRGHYSDDNCGLFASPAGRLWYALTQRLGRYAFQAGRRGPARLWRVRIPSPAPRRQQDRGPRGPLSASANRWLVSGLGPAHALFQRRRPGAEIGDLLPQALAPATSDSRRPAATSQRHNRPCRCSSASSGRSRCRPSRISRGRRRGCC